MFDILIKNGTVCDGTGAPCFRADIGVSGDRIAYVGTGAVNRPRGSSTRQERSSRRDLSTPIPTRTYRL